LVNGERLNDGGKVMERKPLIGRKLLVVGIILLFVGVTIAPTINFNTVKASTDDDIVEVTTQACGIKGYSNTTVKLTREQYQNLELYLVEFRSRLNQTTTREEAVSIFKEAVVELDKYGLLPKGMSVEQSQRLVIGWNKDLYNSVRKNHHEIFPTCVNAFCLLSLTATKSGWVYPILAPFGPLFMFAVFLSQVFYSIGAWKLYNVLIPIILFLSILNPLKLMNLVMIRGYITDLHSIGIKGFVESDDVFLLVGFTGLMVFTLQDRVYFLGSALAVVPTL
jgi:hypothetical protein